MPYFKSKTGSEELQLFYEDLGNDNPIVFISGWPLTHQMWEYQLTPLRELGFVALLMTGAALEDLISH